MALTASVPWRPWPAPPGASCSPTASPPPPPDITPTSPCQPPHTTGTRDCIRVGVRDRHIKADITPTSLRQPQHTNRTCDCIRVGIRDQHRRGTVYSASTMRTLHLLSGLDAWVADGVLERHVTRRLAGQHTLQHIVRRRPVPQPMTAGWSAGWSAGWVVVRWSNGCANSLASDNSANRPSPTCVLWTTNTGMTSSSQPS